jgi:hypothetical protein
MLEALHNSVVLKVGRNSYLDPALGRYLPVSTLVANVPQDKEGWRPAVLA